MRPPFEVLENEATCSFCGGSTYKETITSALNPADADDFISTVVISGSFMQFVDEDGIPFGPIWPRCNGCISNGKADEPVLKQEVIDVYMKIKGEGNASN